MAVLFGGCSSDGTERQAPMEPELPGLSITLWSAQTELFMEYPTLLRGENAPFSVHLTDLGNFRPLADAQVTLEMEKNGKISRFVSQTSPRAGIFRVDVTILEAGRYTGVLKVKALHVQDRHALGELVVYENASAAHKNASEVSAQGDFIRFLKEQQWGSDFATEVAMVRKIPDNLQVPAIVRPRGGAEGSAVSPVRGYLKSSTPLPIPGQMVQKGQLLATVLAFTSTPQDPAGLELDLRQSETDLSQARQIRDRLEKLLSERAIPARRVEEARSEENRAKAKMETAKARLVQYEQSRSGNSDDEGPSRNAFQIKAPIDGMVTALFCTTGGVVEAGQEILRMMALDRVWIEAEVPEGEADVLRDLKSAELVMPGAEEPISVPGPLGRIQRIGSMVNPENRRIPVIFEMQNSNHRFRIGQSLAARLARGQAREQVSLSVSSIVDDGGKPVVFLQLDGESFQRKAVQTGTVGGGFVQILEGIAVGDRVVSQGAYLIRLAALSTQIPAHGHVH